MFVWTIGDAIGVFFLGLLVLFGALVLLSTAVEKVVTTIGGIFKRR